MLVPSRVPFYLKVNVAFLEILASRVFLETRVLLVPLDLAHRDLLERKDSRECQEGKDLLDLQVRSLTLYSQ